ncbi:MAG: GYF domain-containing protein, partial [Myxococcota bacterium]|nr:GYF domain-containing protein [Myxococcota bacterium]
MIFACGRCRTRYKIPDDKVLGRVLKVRCKSCGAVVVVRDPALASHSAPVAPASEAEWFVAIRGRQHGPMSLAALVTLAQDGTVSATNYAWRNGMAEWLKVRDIKELDGLLRVATAPPVPPPQPAADAPADVPQIGAPVGQPAPEPEEDLADTVLEEAPPMAAKDDLGTRVEAVAAPAADPEPAPQETQEAPPPAQRPEPEPPVPDA